MKAKWIDQVKKVVVRAAVKFEKIAVVYYSVLLVALTLVVGKQMRIVTLYQTTNLIGHGRLDYDEFRKMQLSSNCVGLGVETYEDGYLDYMTYQLLANDYNMLEEEGKPEEDIWGEIKKVKSLDYFKEMRDYLSAILCDLKYFPVPEQEDGTESVAFENSWSEPRTYGGNRMHEGTDIMASNNERGYFPVISVTDGVVENKGWLSAGGYRIGIRSEHGGYFYYAHLYDYALDLEIGDSVQAGQILGFMGDSGYGEEGTIGQFPVHLHFGIYINSKEGEMSVNPYYILRYLEEHKLVFSY